LAVAGQALPGKPPPTEPDFDGNLREAIDETIVDMLGGGVLGPLHEHLNKHYDLTLDEIPYRLSNVVESLEVIFGVRGATAMGLMIARRFYSKIGLRFIRNENYKLEDYSQEAKKILLSQTSSTDKQTENE